ncbi:MAG: TfoX/Sxy family DNA transformation protein [Planctomycetota bacterium]|nr:TfoX/Sxy family DNA transformation protein [Planctomycetota bacterium]
MAARTPICQATVYKLYVNFCASQTRKRLQGHGLGVHKVAATDRNQSVILHTATGTHLRDLEALFSDLANSQWYKDLDTPVENLRNLGATSAALLRAINIHTREDLVRCGPTAAYQRIKQQPETTVNKSLLWALAAALSNCDVHDLDESTRRRLLAELD